MRVCSQGTNQLFLLVEEHTLDLNSYSKEDLNQFNYPEEMLNRIDGLIQSQLSGGNEDFDVSVYMPKEIRNDASTLGTTTYHTTTYTSNGRQYTDSYTFFNNFSCDYSKTGTDAYNKARSFVSFLVDCAGVPGKTISDFQFGYSATKTLANLLGISESAVGNGYSKIQTIVTYDATYKLTYWNNGSTGSEPYVGTCRAWLNTNATQQTADCIPAGVQQTSVYLNETMESPHFSNPSGWLYDDYYSAAFVIEGPIYYRNTRLYENKWFAQKRKDDQDYRLCTAPRGGAVAVFAAADRRGPGAL